MNGIIYHAESRIPDLALLLVALVASGSFALSYHNLTQAAIQAGIPGHLAPVFPLTVDAFLAIGSITILRNSLRNESTRVGWSTLITFTLMSIWLNVAVASSTLLSLVCHALPPAALAVSLELFTGFIRSDLMTRGDVAPCTPEPATMKHECISPAPLDQDGQPPGPVSTRDLVMAHFNMNPGCSLSEAARVLGVSRSTVSRHMKALSLTGVVQE